MKKRITQYFQHHPVISSISVAVLFGFLQLSFSYCSKINCPAFADANFDDWFPYKTDQRIIFFNSMQEKDTITIGSIFRTPASSRSGSFGSGSNSCYSNVSINSKESFNNQQSKLSIIGDIYESGENFQLSLRDYFLYNMASSDSGLVLNTNGNNYNLSFEHFRNTTFNGKLYSKLEIISNDTTQVKSPRIYKIWLAIKEGIVAYEEYPSLIRWNKQ